MFDYLDNESEEKLKQLMELDTVYMMKTNDIVIGNLVNNGHIQAQAFRDMRGGINYVLNNITQKGKTYFELKDKHEKQIAIIQQSTNNLTINASGNNSLISAVQGNGVSTQTNNRVREATEPVSKKTTKTKMFGIIVGIATIIGAIVAFIELF